MPKIKTLTTYRDRAFQINGPKLWNSLPISLRAIWDFDHFKSGLKTYHFTKFYDKCM